MASSTRLRYKIKIPRDFFFYLCAVFPEESTLFFLSFMSNFTIYFIWFINKRAGLDINGCPNWPLGAYAPVHGVFYMIWGWGWSYTALHLMFLYTVAVEIEISKEKFPFRTEKTLAELYLFVKLSTVALKNCLLERSD